MMAYYVDRESGRVRRERLPASNGRTVAARLRQLARKIGGRR